MLRRTEHADRGDDGQEHEQLPGTPPGGYGLPVTGR
jgi:hypothetical protein